MTDAPYDEINSLESLPLIAGNDFTFKYDVYDEDGVALDISGATTYLLLSPYGQPDYAQVQVSGTVTGLNTFQCSLSSVLSRNLSGWYIQQPVLISFSGTEYRPTQGLVIFGTRTPYT